MAVIPLELVGETECHNGQSRIILSTRFVLAPIFHLSSPSVNMFAFFAMDVTDAYVPSCLLQCFAEQTGVGETVFHDATIALEAEVDEVVVLSDNLSSWA